MRFQLLISALVSFCLLASCGQDPVHYPFCADGVKNGTETAVDCGGSCSPCSLGAACKVDNDCALVPCVVGSCQDAKCTDEVKNGDETDVDCGGSCALDCATDGVCASVADCVSGVCTGSLCIGPSCADGVKNGAEADMDCGGSCPSGCATGEACSLANDCTSGVCTTGVCVAATCTDGLENGTETDTDCGGPCVTKCGNAKVCAKQSDCITGVCTANSCQPATCVDLQKNGDETDVDCGGSCSKKCAVNGVCSLPADCASAVCAGNLCQVPTCSDTFKNGNETATDCGGSCTGCAIGEACSAAGDCQSGNCTGGVCAATCGNYGQECCGGTTCSGIALSCNGQTKCACTSGFQCGPTCCAFGELCSAGACVAPPTTCLGWSATAQDGGTCTTTPCPRTCLDIKISNPAALDGVYQIDPSGSGTPIPARCDMTLDGGGWTLVGHENSSAPSAGMTGVMAYLSLASGTPGELASGSADAFIGPRFQVGVAYTSARLSWCNPGGSQPVNRFLKFDTAQELFAESILNTLDTQINLTAFTTNDSYLSTLIETPNDARFCRAANPSTRPGDTSWAVKGLDGNFECGCNSGGWAGVGAYYGGTGNNQCTYCGCSGGGWSGSVADGGTKGGVNVNESAFWVR